MEGLLSTGPTPSSFYKVQYLAATEFFGWNRCLLVYLLFFSFKFGVLSPYQVLYSYKLLFNRPGVRCSEGCYTNNSVINSLIDWVSHPFPHNLHNAINPKPLELGTCNFYTMLTTCHVSSYHVSCVMSNFFLQICVASWWRVCYQQGLLRLVYHGSVSKMNCL